MNTLKLIILSVVLLFSRAAVAQITSPAPYCNAGYDDAAGFAVPHYISNVVFGTLSNSTGTTQFPGLHYAYYNSLAAPSLTQGSTYPLSITHNGGASIHFVAVYIDFNHNNSFADAGERVLQQTITGAGVTNPATASVTIPLTAVAGVTRMRVMVFEDDEYTWMGGATDATPCTPDATGLLDWGETEDYNVNIVGSGGPTCPPVTGLVAGSITSSGATISWSAATGATGYEWKVITSATPPASGTSITATTTPAGGLTAATAYYAHVRTACGTSFSTWTNVPFTTLSTAPPCPAVTGLTASAITSSGATISWTAATGATGYEWKVITSATPPASGTTTTATTTPASGLAAATAYHAHVRTACGTGFSTWTNVPFTTLPLVPPCAAVTGLTATAITGMSATINWTPAPGSLGYQYVISTSVLTPTTSGTNTTTTTVNATALISGTTYYAHVRDSCGTGNFSTWITLPFTTLSVLCNAPVSLTVSGISHKSAALSWLPATGAIRTQWVVDTNPADPTTSGTSTALATVVKTGLLPATVYYAHVRDSCAAGLSAWVTKTFTTTAQPAGIDDVEDGGLQLSVYPNPVNDVVTIDVTGGAENGQIVLTDIAGNTIQTLIVRTGSNAIDMSYLPTGIYLVRYMDAVHTRNIKVSRQQTNR